MFEVDPVTNKLLSRRSFALRNLIFVMWKHKIDTTGVNIESFSEILHRPLSAPDVPTWTSPTDFCVPRRLGLSCGFFPQRKIASIFFLVFVCVHSFAATCDVSGEIDLRKFSVLGERSYTVVNGAVRPIGVVGLEQLLN